MRLWSLHPRYLDAKGLVALWREALLAQAVLCGKTRGYKHHPQLIRFADSPAPKKYVAAYLKSVHAESRARGYRFDGGKIGRTGDLAALPVTRGQMAYEWSHLMAKLKARAPVKLKEVSDVKKPEAHPLFRIVPGGVAPWEVLTPAKR